MKKEQRREQLLQCALNLFAKRGYHSISVADIIREAGVARGTFYLYFKNKRDIFQELLNTNFNYIYRIFPDLKLTSGMTEKQLENALLQSLRRLLSHKNSVLFINLVMQEAMGTDKGFRDQVDNFFKTITDIFCGMVARAQSLGKARQADPYLVARFIVGILKEAIYQWAKGEIKNLDALSKNLVKFVMFGIHGEHKISSQ